MGGQAPLLRRSAHSTQPRQATSTGYVPSHLQSGSDETTGLLAPLSNKNFLSIFLNSSSCKLNGLGRVHVHCCLFSFLFDLKFFLVCCFLQKIYLYLISCVSDRITLQRGLASRAAADGLAAGAHPARP